MNTKQVIVFRKDLLKGPNAIRKGKFGAQVAHASLGSLLQLFNKIEYHPTSLINGTLTTDTTQTFYRYCVDFSNNSVLNDWLNDKFTKVVVSVDSDEELIALNKALDEIKHTFGKSAVLRATSELDNSMVKIRNKQIGGHRK